MSRLETAAKPHIESMLKGQLTLIDEDAAKIVADWITLKMMVWEHTDPRASVFTRAQTVAFSHRKNLPENVTIWLFRSTDVYLSARVIRAFTGLFTTTVVPLHLRETANTQTVLFGVGELLIYFIHSQLPEFGLGEFRAVDAVKLWPLSRREISWPPVNRLTSDEGQHVAETLHRFLSRPGMVAI
jgi:hypothetical protein